MTNELFLIPGSSGRRKRKPCVWQHGPRRGDGGHPMAMLGEQPQMELAGRAAVQELLCVRVPCYFHYLTQIFWSWSIAERINNI